MAQQIANVKKVCGGRPPEAVSCLDGTPPSPVPEAQLQPATLLSVAAVP